MLFPWWRSKTRRMSRPAPAPRRVRTVRPELEHLEDRCLPASVNPTQMPMYFEANQGQSDSSVNFLAHGQGYTLFLTPAQAVLTMQNAAGADVLGAQLVGGNAAAAPVGLDLQPGTANYFLGNDSSQWVTGIATYGQVEYQNVYNGVDLVYYGNSQGQLEYDFVVHPGADPGVIQLNFQGAQGVALDGQGNLVVHLSSGDVVQHAPVLYQTINGVQQAVTGSFVLEGGNQVGFSVGAYDQSQALTIDPILGFSSYFGGISNDNSNALAVDSSGNMYIGGNTNSASFPLPTSPSWTTINGPNNVSGSVAAGNPAGLGTSEGFVAKFSPTGTLLYVTYLGGSQPLIGNSLLGTNSVNGIAVDPTHAGTIYVTGTTTAPDFPTTAGALRTTKASASTISASFLTVLDTTTNSLTFAAPSNTAVGTTPTAMTSADLNGDFIPDLAVVNQASNTLSVFKSNGNGTFTPTTNSPYSLPVAASNPDAVVAGLFNNGALSDLVVGSETPGASSALTIYNNNGAGTNFSSFNALPLATLPPSPPGPPHATALAAGNINSNNNQLTGLVVADDVDGQVYALVNNFMNEGNGIFGVTQVITTVGSPATALVSPHAVALADFNDALSGSNTPILDLVIVDNTGVYVLPGTGNGTFNAAGAIKISAITTFTSVVAADANGNPISFNGATFANGVAKGGIALTDSTGKVWVFNNTTASVGGTISFDAGTSFNVGANPVSVAVGNFNGDGENGGLPDLAVANKAGNTVTVLVNTTTTPGGAVNFTSSVVAVPGANPSPSAIVAADFNNDFETDFITANSGTANFSYFQNTRLPLYSTYLSGAGSGGLGDQGNGIAIQGTSLYIVGTSASANFKNNAGNIVPVVAKSTGQDAFVFKFDITTPSAPTFQWQTFYGGGGTDSGTGIALDSSGNPYIVGTEASGNLVTAGTPLQSSFAGSTTDAFVAGFAQATGVLTYGTYVGNGNDGRGIALDSSNNIYIVGDTPSSSLAIAGTTVNTANTAAFQNAFSGSTTNGYIANWALGATTLTYASYIGGNGAGTDANGVAVDAAGNAYVVGTVNGTFAGNPNNNLQTPGGTTPAGYSALVNHGGSDAYLLKVKAGAGANGVAYFNYLGGAQNDAGTAIVVSAVSIGGDPNNGNVSATNPYIFLTGNTSSSTNAPSNTFPVTNGSKGDQGNAGNSNGDGWVMRVDPKAPPTITSITGNLTEGDNSDTLTINGTNFDAGTSVVFTVGGTTVNLSGAGVVTFVNANQITVAVPHTFNPGVNQKVLLAEEAGVTITVLTGEGSATAPYSFGVQSAAEAANTVTLTTTTANGFAVGQSVFVSGVGAGYNGLFKLTGVNGAAHTISYTDPTSGLGPLGAGGTVTLAIGDATLTNPAFAGVLTANPATTEGSALPGGASVVLATFTDNIATTADATANDFTTTGIFPGNVSVNWGDGNTDTSNAGVGNGALTIAQVAGTTQFQIKGNHTYAEEGSFTVTITVTDEGGATSSTSGTVVVGDGALSGLNVPAITAGTEGGNVTVTGSFSDAKPVLDPTDFSTNPGDIILTYSDGRVDDVTGTAVAGGGAASVTVGMAGGKITFSDTRPVGEEGNFTVSVSIKDLGGSTLSTASPVAYSVNEAAIGAVTPNNAIPALTEGGSTGAVNLFTFTDIAADNPPGGEGTSQFNLSINWGDGSPADTTTGSVTFAAGVYTVKSTGHTYAEELPAGTNIMVTIKYDVNAPAALQLSQTVNVPITVNDATLTMPVMSALAAVNEQTSTGTILLATFKDNNPNAGAGTLTDFTSGAGDVTVNWGDGTIDHANGGPVSVTFNAGTGNFEVRDSHTYTDEIGSPFTVTVTAKDKGGAAQVSNTTTITVNDPALTNVTPVNPFVETIDQPSGAPPGTFQTLITFQDPAPESTGSPGPPDYTFTVNFGAGASATSSKLVFLGGTTYAIQGLATYLSSNPGWPGSGFHNNYITGTIKHEGQAAIPWAVTLDVVSNPVFVNGGLTFTATEGLASASQPVATFTDPNGDTNPANFTAVINWGDGTTSPGTVSGPVGGVFTVSGAHTYPEEGGYAITVTISHPQYQSGTDTANPSAAAVGDAPLAGTAVPVAAAARVTASVTVATFTDANPNAPVTDFSAVINWGDGTSSAGTVFAVGTSFSVTGTHAYTAPGTFTFTVQITDVGGSTLTLTGTATVRPSPIVTTVNYIVAGADAGGGPQVNVYNAATNQLIIAFNAFPATFAGGVRVATGDVNGDGIPDIIVGAGPGGGPEVRVFDGRTFQPLPGKLGGFYGITPSSFTGGVYVATGDINGDGLSDIIVGAGEGGGPQITVFSGKDGSILLGPFNATAPGFTGGARVASGDYNGDGLADIGFAAGPGGLSQVTIFDGQGNALNSFFAFPGNFTGGSYLAMGDLNGDGIADLVVSAGPSALPQVIVYDGASGNMLSSFFANIGGLVDQASPQGLPRTGVRVAVSVFGTQSRVVTMGGPGSAPLVDVLDGMTLQELDSFFAFAPFFRGGGFVGG